MAGGCVRRFSEPDAEFWDEGASFVSAAALLRAEQEHKAGPVPHRHHPGGRWVLGEEQAPWFLRGCS